MKSGSRRPYLIRLAAISCLAVYSVGMAISWTKCAIMQIHFRFLYRLISFHNIKYRAFCIEPHQYTLPLQLTPPGTLTAHTKSALVLLHSCPDTVQRHILRETQTSTPLIKGSCTNADPPPFITPTIADCGYKAPLAPRLHDVIIITSYLPISQ